MQKIAKVAAGSAAALAILVAGGLAIALPAQAAPIGASVSVVEPVNTADTDNVQDKVGDQAGVDGAADTETADSTENTNDDINGVAVEDGHQD